MSNNRAVSSRKAIGFKRVLKRVAQQIGGYNPRLRKPRQSVIAIIKELDSHV